MDESRSAKRRRLAYDPIRDQYEDAVPSLLTTPESWSLPSPFRTPASSSSAQIRASPEPSAYSESYTRPSSSLQAEQYAIADGNVARSGNWGLNTCPGQDRDCFSPGQTDVEQRDTSGCLETSGRASHLYNTTRAVASSQQEGIVCFGMLADVACVPTVRDVVVPLIMDLYYDRHKLRCRHDDSVIIDILDKKTAETLGVLLNETQLDVQLSCRRRPQHRFNQRRGQHPAQKCSMMLSAIIYGHEEHQDIVGDYLQASDMYLQDPVGCNRQVPYRNPHKLFQSHDDCTALDEPERGLVQDVSELAKAPGLLAEFEYSAALPEVETPKALSTGLYGHQKQGLYYMLSREQGWCFDQHMHNIWYWGATLRCYTNTINGDQQCEPPPDCRGGILADEMGLGKTLSVIALIASDKENAPVTKSISKYSRVATTLLVARAPLLAVWLRQLTQHLKPGALKWRVHHSSQRIRNAEALRTVDVVLTTYQTLVAEWKKHKASQQQALFSVMWHRVVLDEAHDVRDTRSKTAQAVYALQAARRWAVTGTPIQNRIDDLAGLYRFLRVYPYDEPPIFRNQIKLLCDMPNKDEANDRLKRLIQSIMLRRSITHVTLPERKDLICRLNFSSEERALYDSAKNDTLSCISATVEDQGSGINALQALTRLRLLCNHGTLYHGRHTKYQSIHRDPSQWQQSDAQDAYNAMVMAGSAVCFACKADIGSSSAEIVDQVVGAAVRPILSSCMQLCCCSCQEQLRRECLSCGHQPSHAFQQVCTSSSNMPASPTQNSPIEKMPTKIQALLRDVKEHASHEKCVVFSFWTTTLDVIQTGLQQLDLGFARFDGNVRAKNKAKVLDAFAADPAVRIALLTISCGAVGLDLTAASRAYLMEPHWNPSVEEQALARIYRIGQRRPVTTVRYIMRNTLEEHVLKVQKRKNLLVQSLLSEEQEADAVTGLSRLEQLRVLLQD